MTKVEIMKKIEELNEREFYINMVDHWTNEDRQMLRDIKRERTELEKKLN